VVVPEARVLLGEEPDQVLVAACRQQGVEAGDRALVIGEATIGAAPDVLDDREQAIGPARRVFGSGAELAPVIAEALEVVHVFAFHHGEEALEPGLAQLGVGWTLGDDLHKIAHRVVGRRADGAGRTVYLFDCGRKTLEEEHATFGGQGRVLARDLLDLADRLLDALDGGLRTSPEGVAPEACAEAPLVIRLRSGAHGIRDSVGCAVVDPLILGEPSAQWRFRARA
jgi:hypothetical protein